MSHIFLFYLFNGNFLASHKMCAQLDQTKLAFSQNFIELIVVKHIRIAHSLLKAFLPNTLVTNIHKIY